MTTPSKKRTGRPRKDPTSVGPANYHLGLRLSDERAAKLKVLVERANERAREAGVPAHVTPSSLVSLWIAERIELELAKKK